MNRNIRNSYLPEVPEYRAHIHALIEAAIVNSDEVISLLAALGAEVEVPIKSSISTHGQHMSLLQWTSKAISFLESRIAPKLTQSPKEHPDPPIGDTWSQYFTYLAEVLFHSKTENMGYVSLHGLYLFKETTPAPEGVYSSATKEYLTFAESVLRAHGATLPEGALTSEQPVTGEIGTQKSVTSQGPGYRCLGEYKTSDHLKVFYDELYEACWKADNATIWELCLPKHLAEGKEPIQIAVQTTPASDPYSSIGASPAGAVMEMLVI
jgi:hypothetical protein